jgi:hypothetical protein
VGNTRGQDHVWLIENGSWRAAPSPLGRRDEREGPGRGAGAASPASQVLAARFDNLREGAKAVVVAAAVGAPWPRLRRRRQAEVRGAAMWITRVSINNPVFATMVMVALCVLGLFSYSKLGVEQMPDISFPGAWMEVRYPGASARGGGARGDQAAGRGGQQRGRRQAHHLARCEGQGR